MKGDSVCRICRGVVRITGEGKAEGWGHVKGHYDHPSYPVCESTEEEAQKWYADFKKKHK